MQIVWDQKVITQLKKSHTVLELETFQVNGEAVTAYCVVPFEKIGLTGFENLENYKQIHAAFVKAYYDKDYKLCEDCAEQLLGNWGGEVDTFYQEILGRIRSEQSEEKVST